ncbi:MAG: hypothetical protein H6707_20245 [Deltaproteobacteria bacterium]|nr:hypothetical protein [Deltaproteobacteria bacterium]
MFRSIAILGLTLIWGVSGVAHALQQRATARQRLAAWSLNHKLVLYRQGDQWMPAKVIYSRANQTLSIVPYDAQRKPTGPAIATLEISAISDVKNPLVQFSDLVPVALAQWKPQPINTAILSTIGGSGTTSNSTTVVVWDSIAPPFPGSQGLATDPLARLQRQNSFSGVMTNLPISSELIQDARRRQVESMGFGGRPSRRHSFLW